MIHERQTERKQPQSHFNKKEKAHTHAHTQWVTRKTDTPLQHKQQHTDWLSDQSCPAAWSRESLCCVDVFSLLWTWWEGGEVSPKTSLDHWQRRCLPPLTHSHSLLSGFADSRNYFFLASFIRRDWEKIFSQRMLPQVIRILYVLSFCFFQGGFIRWGALTFLIFLVVCATCFPLLSWTALHQLFRDISRLTFYALLLFELDNVDVSLKGGKNARHRERF